MAFLDDIRQVHVIGAGGIGVSAAAKFLQRLGLAVSGTDVGQNEATRELEKLGIPVARGQAAGNLPPDCDLVVYTSAAPADNPERVEAARRGIRQMSYFEFIGELSRDRRTVAVSGTNGKSTTTAILGLILERASLDPLVIVGSKVQSFADQNLRFGRGGIFVVEACEHQANMLKLAPQMIVLTNIEADHLDFYRDLDHIRETFQKYVEKLPAGGALILNADDPVSRGLRPPVPAVTYGLDQPADYRVRNLTVGRGRQTFEIVRRVGGEEKSLGEFVLRLPGRFNVHNALAAVAAASELGASPEICRAAVADFTGIWRRFELVGERAGAPIYSDYGHHPTAVAGTLAAVREFHPGRRVVLAFQPHQHNRTRRLFDEFVASFDGADALILPEIFEVAGREASEDAGVSSRDLVEAVRRRDAAAGRERPVIYAESLPRALESLRHLAQPNDVILLMGAGDIYRLADQLAG